MSYLYLQSLTLYSVLPTNLDSIVGWSVEFFLIGQNRSSNQRSGMFLKVQIRSFHERAARIGAWALKFSFSKNPGGPNINIFLWKIGMKLPFTIKNKHRNTNLKFEFQNYFIFTPKKVCFWFWRKTPKTNFFFVFWLWFNNNCLLQSLTIKCSTYCRVWLLSVLPTTESDSTVSCLLQSQTL